MFKYFIILILAFFQVSVNHMMVSQNISNSNFQFKQEFLHFVGSNEKCVVVGENDEYVFAVVYPWNNTPEETDRRNGLTAKGYPVSGLYTNDEEKKPIYQLPELRKVYDIQVSFDGEEVWLISNQLINLSSDKEE